MATLRMTFIHHDRTLGITNRFYASVIGKKMPAKWMRDTYGPDWRDSYTAMYICRKNPYKIVWLSESRDRHGNVTYNYTTHGKPEIELPKNNLCGDTFFFSVK